MERVKKYLQSIAVPFTEEPVYDGKNAIKLQYGTDLCAIFPGVPEEGDGPDEFHVVIAYDGKVQQARKMSLDELKNWLYEVFVKNSEDYVYADEPKGDEQ